MKIQKNDKVKVIAGKHKGHVGKVLEALPKQSKVVVEGVNPGKRTIKASVRNPRATQIEINRPIDISNVMLVGPGDKTSRVGYKVDDKGNKSRVYRQLDNKEVA